MTDNRSAGLPHRIEPPVRGLARHLPAPRGEMRGRRLAAPAARCRLAVQLVAHRFEISPRQILGYRRGSRRAVRARQAAMYLAHVALGLPIMTVGQVFGRHHSTVAHACHTIEDRRDEPEFDAALADMETVARALARAAEVEATR
jgi:hypothetical protein